jgi:hypothetical protein
MSWPPYKYEGRLVPPASLRLASTADLERLFR